MKNNNEGLITVEDLLEEVLEKLKRHEEILKKLHEAAKNSAAYDDFDFIDNNDLQKCLHISDRTALKLRKRGILKYYKVDGKIFYKKAVVDEMIEKGVKPD